MQSDADVTVQVRAVEDEFCDGCARQCILTHIHSARKIKQCWVWRCCQRACPILAPAWQGPVALPWGDGHYPFRETGASCAVCPGWECPGTATLALSQHLFPLRDALLTTGYHMSLDLKRLQPPYWSLNKVLPMHWDMDTHTCGTHTFTHMVYHCSHPQPHRQTHTPPGIHSACISTHTDIHMGAICTPLAPICHRYTHRSITIYTFTATVTHSWTQPCTESSIPTWVHTHGHPPSCAYIWAYQYTHSHT